MWDNGIYYALGVIAGFYKTKKRTNCFLPHHKTNLVNNVIPMFKIWQRAKSPVRRLMDEGLRNDL